MTGVDDRVLFRLGIRLGLAQDREDGRAGRRGPAGEQPRALERVPGERAEPDHQPSTPFTASCSVTASTRMTGESGSPARSRALVNSSVALAIASARLSACTTSVTP